MSKFLYTFVINKSDKTMGQLKNGNFRTTIAGCKISWFVNNTTKITELTEYEEERIQGLLADGYTQGEINMTWYGRNGHSYEATGWWQIMNWEDMAMELYNALRSNNAEMTAKAIKRYEENF